MLDDNISVSDFSFLIELIDILGKNLFLNRENINDWAGEYTEWNTLLSALVYHFSILCQNEKISNSLKSLSERYKSENPLTSDFFQACVLSYQTFISSFFSFPLTPQQVSQLAGLLLENTKVFQTQMAADRMRLIWTDRLIQRSALNIKKYQLNAMPVFIGAIKLISTIVTDEWRKSKMLDFIQKIHNWKGGVTDEQIGEIKDHLDGFALECFLSGLESFLNKSNQ